MTSPRLTLVLLIIGTLISGQAACQSGGDSDPRFVTAPSNPAADGQRGVQGDLTLTIVVDKDEAGDPVIDRAGIFKVLFTNHSEEPIRLWSRGCKLGYEALSFRAQDGDGPSSLMSKQMTDSANWRTIPLETITIPPGVTFLSEVRLCDASDRRAWVGVPEPNTGQLVTLTAAFEIPPSDAAEKHGIWTGLVTSEPINARIVDANLQTPFDYLGAGFLKQAIKMIQADPTWMQKRGQYDWTLLHLAVIYDFIDATRWLLANGADVNAITENESTPLCRARDPEIVALLVEFNADLNAKDSNGQTTLERAASEYARDARSLIRIAERDRALAITRILLEAGAEYDIRSACILNDAARVSVLVADEEQACDTEAMRWAATFGRVEIVKLLLEHGADPENAEFIGFPATGFAIQHADVLKMLFDAGADPGIRFRFNYSGRVPPELTLLHQAARMGAIESAELLLTNGIDVDVTVHDGRTPLHDACGFGPAEMVVWLLEHGADVTAYTNDGWTPMSMAAYHVYPTMNDDQQARQQTVIRILERVGVEVDIFATIACDDLDRVSDILQTDPKAGEVRDPHGRPALHRAVALDRREIVKLLLDHGTDPDIRAQWGRVDDEGETALFVAVSRRRLEMAEMLIACGADVNARRDHDLVPLHGAASRGPVELARLLLEHGADVNARDDMGRTPMDWAGPGASPEMPRFLRSHGGTG